MSPTTLLGDCQDSNGNSINPFSQLVTNSSSLANDQTNPTITGSPSINPDGSSFQLNFSEAISKDSLTSFDTNQFKLFVDGIEQTAGSFSIDLTQFDSPAGTAAPAANTPINSVTVQINGATIEAGQNVLLSYAINDPNGSTGITDTSGNNLANFTYQLDNFSSQDYTAPEITEGNVDSDGSTINVNVSEFIGFRPVLALRIPLRWWRCDPNYVPPLVALQIIQVLVADPATGEFDWNSDDVKAAFTLNVNGRDLASSDFTLAFDAAMQDIVVRLQPSAQIFAGQSVTLDFDSTKLADPSAPQITDNNGNSLQSNTIVIDNDSSVDDPNPTLEEIESQLKCQ